jgi:hypothetical protein
MTPIQSSPAIPVPRRPPPDPGNPLAAIADVPSREQDRLLWQHGEAVADHMADHFARRPPHLAARSFARWQRAVAVALAAMVLLAIASAVLSAMLAAAIALITAAHVVIAVAARWHRPRAATGGPAAAVPDAAVPSYTILVPAYHEQEVIGGTVVPGEHRLSQGPAGGPDPDRAAR